MKNYGNWTKAKLTSVINTAIADGEVTIALDQEHTDRANDLYVCAWLEELGYTYEVDDDSGTTVVQLKKLNDAQELLTKVFEINGTKMVLDRLAFDERSTLEKLVYEYVESMQNSQVTDDYIVEELKYLGITVKNWKKVTWVTADAPEPNPVKAFQVARNYYVLAYTEREAIDFWYKMENPTTADVEESMRGGYGEVSLDRVIKTTRGKKATIRDLINDFVELKITFPGSFRDYSHGRQ